jgi:murein DD-endopeptidase MepM/ murein hydrolase activator NlpD
MDTPLVLAWLHLLALAVGLAGVWARARALRDSLRDPEDQGAVRRAFIGQAWWSVALVLWIVTGVWRLSGNAEQSISYYFTNLAFALKIALVLGIIALEVWPLMTLVRWRAKRALPNPHDIGRIEMTSYVQCVLVVVTVLASVSTARSRAAVAPAAASSSGARGTPGRTASIATRTDTVTTTDSADLVPVPPSGVETVTADDIALLTREIAMPLDGVDPAKLHSNFDERRGGGARQHQALDIMAPRRTPIRSAANGRVLKLFTSVAGGLMVYAADSSERFILMYAHLDGYAPGLRDGAPLTRGQLIGYVGFTGNAIASAPHLHFAIARSADVKHWSTGKPIDPFPVLLAAKARGSTR